jgi:hypothetical protein
MNKVMILATLVTAAILFVFGQANSDQRVEEEISRLNDQEVEALLRNDVKTLGRLWSEDFIVTNPFNKFLNKQALAAPKIGH